MILLDFPCFIGILAVSGFWKPNSPFVIVDPQNGPFYAPETLRLKGEMSILMPKYDTTGKKKTQKDKWFHFLSSDRPNLPPKYYKTGEKRQRTNGSLSHMYGRGLESRVETELVVKSPGPFLLPEIPLNFP